MKKKILSLALLLSVTSSAFAVEAEIDGLWYELISKAKEATVIQYKNNNYYSGDIVIPETVEYNEVNYSVTSIKGGSNYYDGAFYNCSGLTSVTIPNSVTSIGGSAFSSCSGLTSVTIPNSVTSIGGSAFYGCSGLTSVTIPNSVTSIGNQAFCDCRSLTSVSIPNSVTSIGGYAFYNCCGLTSVTIPNSVTSIGGFAFYGCSGLTSVTIPNSVTSIGSTAFYGCGLTSVHISDIAAWCKIAFSDSYSNPLYYAHHLYLGEEEIKDLVIPNSVTSIGDYAFRGCTGLTSVTIPNSVTSIGYLSFYGCSGLTSVTIPNSVTSLKGGTFYGCSSLTTLSIPNSVTCIEDADYYNYGYYGVFGNCTGLTSVTIPNSVTSIGDYAFYNCSGLTSVTIPNSVTSIGKQTFHNCSGLTTITIGNGIKSIYSQAFAKCPELADVYCYAEAVPSTKTDAFEDSYINYATLHVPTASIDAYKAKVPWKRFKTIMGLDGTMHEEPETPKCATPTIAFMDGKLKFSCETEDVEYVSEVTVGDAKKNYSSEVSLTGIYKVSVYATKVGYENSDIATLEFTLGASGEVCDVNKDGIVDVADIATIIDRMAGKE